MKIEAELFLNSWTLDGLYNDLSYLVGEVTNRTPWIRHLFNRCESGFRVPQTIVLVFHQATN